MSIKIYSTQETAAKTGLTDRSVRRRLDTDFAPRVTIQGANRVTYGVTEESLKAFVKNAKSKN